MHLHDSGDVDVHRPVDRVPDLRRRSWRRGGYGWLHALNSSYSIGGYGVHVTGAATVTGGASLTVAVAGNGGNGGNFAAGSAGSQGGGAGGSANRGGGGGGGASSVFAGASALLVAAGGGGAGGSGTAGNGGAAGSPGQNGASIPCAGGGAGTTSGPGAGGSQAGCIGGGGASGTGTVGGDGGASSSYASGGGGGGGYFGGGGGQGSDQGDAAGGGGGSSYSTDAGASITVDSTGTPSVEISWSLPAPTVAGTVKDYATSQPWSGTEVAGARAYASSSITQINSTVPTGSVTYSWYSGSGCSGSPTSSDIQSLAGDGSVPDSAATGPLSAGDYSVMTSYAGDSNYAANAECDNFSVLAQLGAPTVTTVAPADGRATVNWTPATPGTSPITGYSVSVFAPDGSPAIGVTGATVRSAAASATRFVFTGLSDGVSYAFSVRASDANGPGPSSQLSATAVPRPRLDRKRGGVGRRARHPERIVHRVALRRIRRRRVGALRDRQRHSEQRIRLLRTKRDTHDCRGSDQRRDRRPDRRRQDHRVERDVHSEHLLARQCGDRTRQRHGNDPQRRSVDEVANDLDR